MDFYHQLERYVGHTVSISTYGHAKIIGRVNAVFPDCVRLRDTLTLGELDDQGWFHKMQHMDPDSNYGPRDCEAIIPFHPITSITCLDDEPIEDPLFELSNESLRTDVDGPFEPDDEAPALAEAPVDDEASALAQAPVKDESAAWRSAVDVRQITVELGVGLLGLVDPHRGGDLLDRVSSMRESIAADSGLVVPSVRIRDAIQLDQDAYRILMNDHEVAAGGIFPNYMLAINSGNATGELDGVAALDPRSGRPSVWIDPAHRDKAELLGYWVIEPVVVLTVRLTEVIRRFAAEWFSYEQVAELLEAVSERYPHSVEEVVPDCVPIRFLHEVLRRLLQESIPIKPLRQVLECLGRPDLDVDDFESTMIQVRERIGRTICSQHLEDSGTLFAAGLEPSLADELAALADEADDARGRARIELLSGLIREQWGESERADRPVILMAPTTHRRQIWRAVARSLPEATVLAHAEVPSDVAVDIFLTIGTNGTVGRSGEAELESAAPRRAPK